jgi:3-oxoacyl-[acyl-carrier-protein] synthase-1
MMAGIDRRQALEYCDNRGNPIIGSRLSVIDPGVSVEQRWLFMLAGALKDAMVRVGAARLEELPLFLSLPMKTSGGAYDARFLAEELSARLGVSLLSARIKAFADGACGGYTALATARSALQRGDCEMCVVAGADSLIGARSLLKLAQDGRLLVEENSDGVIPGEAAAALVLSARQREPLAIVRGIGFGNEPASLDNDVPLRGLGIGAATRAALDEAGMALHDIDFRVSDAAGESYHFKEQALLVARLLQQRKEQFPLWLCAESLGDCGAAMGICGVAYAVAAITHKRATGRRAITFAGNDRGYRAAVVLDHDANRRASV